MITFKTGDRKGLFDELGRVFYTAQQAITASNNIATAYNNAAAAASSQISETPEALAGTLETYGVLMRNIQRSVLTDGFAAANTLVEHAVAKDAGQKLTRAEALKYVIQQMTQGGYYINGPTVSVNTSKGANTGDAELFVQSLGPDGRASPDWLPQTLTVQTKNGSPLLYAKAAKNTADVEWPGGSGAYGAMVPTFRLGDGILKNQPLEHADNRWSDWTAIGSQISALLPPRDEIQYSASPTGGYFRLKFTSRDSTTKTSADIPYDATAATVAAVIGALDPELKRVSVSARSGGPGFTLDWPRGRYDLPLMTVESYLQGATISVVRTRAGTAGGYLGYGINFNGNGAELTGLFQRVTLARAGAGLAIARIFHDGASAGTVQIGLFKEAASTAQPINRPNGQPNAASFYLSSLAANQFHVITCPLAWAANTDGFFGIRLTTAITNGKRLAINWPQMILWSSQRWQPAIALCLERFGLGPNDSWTVTVSNNLSGQLMTWWIRAFPELETFPPTSGTTLIPDSVIAQ